MRLRNKAIISIGLLFLIIITVNYGFAFWQKNTYYNKKEIAKKGRNAAFGSRIGDTNSNNEIDLKYSGFSGGDVVWNLTSKEDTEITFDYDSTVSNGNFKVALVNLKNQEIENILEGTEQGNKTIKVAEGEYMLKIVGKNAEGKIKFLINDNKNVEIARMH